MKWQDHVALKALIDSDAANAAKTDQQILDDFFKATVTVKNDISWTDYMMWLFDTDGVKKLEDAKATGGTDAIKNAAGLALIVAQAGKDLTLSRDDVRGAMTPLIGPVFTVAEKDALLAKSDAPTPRWQSENLPVADDASMLFHINLARA